MRACLTVALLALAGELCFAPPPSAHAQSSDIEREWRTFNMAQSAHTRGRTAALAGDRSAADAELGNAAELYRQLLVINSLRKDLYAPLADTLLRRGNAAAAYALCVQQVRAGVREVPLQVQLIHALIGMRRFRHAVEEAGKFVQATPGDPRLLAAQGEAAAEAGETELAVRALGQALAGKGLKTGLQLETGLEVDVLRMTYARMLLLAGRPAEVAGALGALVTAGGPDALLLLGRAQLAAGAIPDAIATLQRAVARSAAAQRAQATVLLSQALRRGGQAKEALTVLRQAGDVPPVLQALAQIYMSDDPPNPAAAAMVLDRAAELDPSDLRICLEHASVLDRAGKLDRALTELGRCEALNLPTADALAALSLRAELQLKLGHLDEGITSLRAARVREAAARDRSQKGPAAAVGSVGPAGLAATRSPLDTRLGQALLRRGLSRIASTAATVAGSSAMGTPSAAPGTPAASARTEGTAAPSELPSQPLRDLEEAQLLLTSERSAHALAVALLHSGRPGDAITLLAPLCEGPKVDPKLLGLFGRALRENGQPAQALSVLLRAEQASAAASLAARETPAAAAAAANFRLALRQDQSETLIVLGRPFDALRLVAGNDETAQHQRASAFLSAVRAYYQPVRGRSVGRRGPFPPLRHGQEQPEDAAEASAGASPELRGGKASRGPFPPLRGPIDLTEVQTSRGALPPLRGPNDQAVARGPFPPLRGTLDHAEGLGAGPQQVLSDEKQVLSFVQAALRAGTSLSASERAEAMLYQVVALSRGGQFDLALRRLNEIATQFDLPTLDALLGPGGFADLKARVTLRGGDFYQGASFAQQALPLLGPAASRALQNAMAVAYTAKAIDLLERGERGDVERAHALLRAAVGWSQGGPPENLARAQYNQAVLQLYRGRAEDARGALSRLDPQTLPAVWLGLGSYHDMTGDSRAALDAYRKYMAVAEPGDPHLAVVRQWVDLLERIYEGAR